MIFKLYPFYMCRVLEILTENIVELGKIIWLQKWFCMLLLIASEDDIQKSLEDAFVIYSDAGRQKLVLL